MRPNITAISKDFFSFATIKFLSQSFCATSLEILESQSFTSA